MRLSNVRILFFVLCLGITMRAQAPAPKPHPEIGKLAALVGGHWTYEGVYKPGPFGPGGKTTGEFTAQTILKGFFVEMRWAEKGPWGEVVYCDFDAYDPVNKNFISNAFGDEGGRQSGTFTLNGNTIAWQGKLFVAAYQFEFRSSYTFAADRTSATGNKDISADGGKTWTPFFEGTYTKAKPPGPERSGGAV